MIFCWSFGLSVDYELFLLFRIRREFILHDDNDRATVAGLAVVGPVITGAGRRSRSTVRVRGVRGGPMGRLRQSPQGGST
jgi:hypothetical protein